MNMAYVTTYDPFDIEQWSGLGFNIAKSLEQQALRLHYIAVERPRARRLRVEARARRTLLRQQHLWEREPAVLRSYAAETKRKLASLDSRAVFAPGTMCLSYLDVTLPTFFWTDSTFAGMIDFYPDWSRLSQRSRRLGLEADQRALSTSSLAIYSSHWAAQTAIENYDIEPTKVKVVPFGPNLDAAPSREEVVRIIDSRSTNVCELLFVAVEWDRKGGDVALAVARSLKEQGLPTRLTIVGCKPKDVKAPSDLVRLYGFVSKRTRRGQDQLRSLFARSHFLMLPSLADATPIVICEASAFGVPTLATRIGGIPTIVRDGVNGRLFGVDDDIDAYSDFVWRSWADQGQYRSLALTTFAEYETRLNWRASGAKVGRLIKEHIG
jgi:glycosyltransferase involved in cell wall biosynthesis